MDAQWYDVIGKFNTKFAEFQNARNALLQKWPQVKDNPAMLAEWTALKNRSDKIYSAAIATAQKIQQAKQYIKDTFGIELGGVSLGILPAVGAIIGVAAVGGVIATLSYFITDVIKFNGKADIFSQAIANGATPTEAAELAEKMDSGALMHASSVLKNALPFALIIAAIYFIPKKRGR